MDRTPSRSHEWPGAIDRPFDSDQPSGQLHIRSDAACSIPWREDGFEAVQVFVDPALVDRAQDLCATVDGLAAGRRTLDELADAILEWAGPEGLSASVIERPPDALTPDIVAVAFTLG